MHAILKKLAFQDWASVGMGAQTSPVTYKIKNQCKIARSIKSYLKLVYVPNVYVVNTG